VSISDPLVWSKLNRGISESINSVARIATDSEAGVSVSEVMLTLVLLLL
jgi:hypothetical protein